MRIDLFDGPTPVRADMLAPVVWNEGLQLLPQHFQILDMRLENLLRRQMLVSTPFSWGLERLEWDDIALSTGVLRVLSAAGQFPDGLVFSRSAQQGPALEYHVSTTVNDERVCYALAVPYEDFNEHGVDVNRYRPFIGAPLADLSNRDEKASIPRWLPNLSIRRWDRTDLQYAQIPFIEVSKTATGFESSGFHPAAVRLLPQSLCARQVANAVHLLRSKAGQLGALALPPLLNTDYRSGLGAILAALVSGIPRLEAHLMSGTAHPYDIHLDLCSIAGLLAPLAGKVPDCFPPYEHACPAAAIDAVTRYIVDIVSNIGVDRRLLKEIPFLLNQAGWTCVMPSNLPDSALLVCFQFSPLQLDASIGTWLEHILICTDGDESRCRELRIRGLPRRQSLALPELGLPALPARRYVHIPLVSNIHAAGSRLFISTPDDRSGITLVNVNLIVVRNDK